MCLITEQKEPFVAKEDITVYKTVEIDKGDKKGVYSSYYGGFYYEFGKLYQDEMEADNSFESYFGNIVIQVYGDYSLDKYTHVHRAFHSMIFERLAFSNRYLTIVECTIPKGSLYYEDKTGLIASNQIIINKIIDYDTNKS